MVLIGLFQRYITTSGRLAIERACALVIACALSVIAWQQSHPIDELVLIGFYCESCGWLRLVGWGGFLMELNSLILPVQ